MNDYTEIKTELKKSLKPERYEHTLYTQKEAIKLAQRYNIDKEKASLSALLHDCAKNIDPKEAIKLINDFGYEADEIMLNNHALLHGLAGSILAKEKYGITDPQMLNAIRYHTTGRENMTALEKIIFLADVIEESRNYEGVEEIRKLAYEDLDKAMILSLSRTVILIANQGKLLHLDTVKARNYLLMQEIK